jgi:hypothetical protein
MYSQNDEEMYEIIKHYNFEQIYLNRENLIFRRCQ